MLRALSRPSMHDVPVEATDSTGDRSRSAVAERRLTRSSRPIKVSQGRSRASTARNLDPLVVPRMATVSKSSAAPRVECAPAQGCRAQRDEGRDGAARRPLHARARPSALPDVDLPPQQRRRAVGDPGAHPRCPQGFPRHALPPVERALLLVRRPAARGDARRRAARRARPFRLAAGARWIRRGETRPRRSGGEITSCQRRRSSSTRRSRPASPSRLAPRVGPTRRRLRGVCARGGL